MATVTPPSRTAYSVKHAGIRGGEAWRRWTSAKHWKGFAELPSDPVLIGFMCFTFMVGFIIVIGMVRVSWEADPASSRVPTPRPSWNEPPSSISR
jgi:hypothetical protein